jgi:hypothetical protein
MRPGGPARPLVHFDGDVLFEFLVSRDAPVMEIEILRFLTHEDRMPSGRRKLFALHFSLFHALYRLKEEAGIRLYYLHLDPMRIRLVKMPPDGYCRHYSPLAGVYCHLPGEREGRCGAHRHDTGTGPAVSYDPLYDFYTNEENIAFGEGDVLEKLMNGVIIYALRKGEIERALRVFGLSRPSRGSIRRRYHELARTYHPDLKSGNETRMKELNHSYQILQEVFVV